ncbi:BAG family molecular chaperone regulator 3-like [Phoenix dactylifera]|uniref:BAG family molecular chaperone regulator 3-like n=1 Tax=Phoenix dactylifera TaxID=42345 RepID=A0A8B9A2F5_PHODC|nr:BAG family molecular chaperone regulator 3-like [Phoenix dactylifera]XP_026664183.2 BAG family molecular chaperone regulator 3-like [Phoenix dactylifera]XP_038978013.1 BAG family molecular chaperone regulator 3-like [Phoenix dactylifera]
MMLGRTKSPAAAKEFSPVKTFPAAVPGADEAHQWEVRPGGMLVQKRDPDSVAAAPTIRVRVKYGAAYHEIYLSSQSTFGELKKLLSERIGLHPEDLKVVYKEKERDPSAYLDISGVKDGSKVVVVDDPAGRAKRLLEMRHRAKIAKASNSISQISLEVDKLASQVSELDAIVTKGGKVAKKDVANLIELLMNQLVKLDGIVADGDLKPQKRMQERRVQKYVEKLDVLKVKNDALKTTNEHMPAQQPPPSAVTTKWETFDSLFSPTTPATITPATATPNASSVPSPRFDWELF